MRFNIASLLTIFSLSTVAQAAPLQFTDQTSAAGVTFIHSHPNDHQSGPMVAGGAVGDFNGDGFADLYIIGGGGAADALFINNRNGTFTDRAEEWGIDQPHRGVGATVGDYDGDGDDDIYVTSYGSMDVIASPGHHRLYRNDGHVFVDVAADAGVAFTTTTHPDGYGAAFGDYDRDGDLDLFVGAWHNSPVLGARLFRNDGNGTFANVTPGAGIITADTHAFGAIWSDMDGDRYPELLVAGDFGTNRYYRNNRDGTFQELDPGTGLAITPDAGWSIGNAYNAMGTTVGDFNRDGRPDWFVTAIWPTAEFASDFWGNGLYINQGDHMYTEAAAGAGVSDGGWGWGTEAIDFDHDGWTDLVMTNGWPFTDSVTGENFADERSYLWRNRGDLTFAEVGEAAGLTHTGQGRALLTLDYDRDGDMDIVVLANDEPAQLFRNDIITGKTPADAHWLQVRLDTTRARQLAPHGAGALITVIADGVRQTQQITTGGSFVAQSELVAHFGLGAARKIQELTVDWGNGQRSRYRKIRADRRLVVRARCKPHPLQPAGSAPGYPPNCSSDRRAMPMPVWHNATATPFEWSQEQHTRK
ncbi:MAG: CRTAC1 family protein [Gammaproteobacteria bacterium]|nr:CRTAC1 family protein [Gammaproteobacteria bacterium]